MSRRPPNPIVKGVTRYFRFLFDRGFEVSNASSFLESLGTWFVEFESRDCYILIFRDLDDVSIRFYPVKADRNIVTDLGFMVYYLTNGQVFIGPEEGKLVGGAKKQLERSAKLLEHYIDRILPYFGKGFEKSREDFMTATKKYDAFLLTKYGLQKLKGRVRGL